MSTVSVATLSRAAVATALTAALAQVTIPLPFTPVPVTLQVLGVLLAALALP
ncbi:MAG: biotin transporter BioY, partial [Firmicutes bacterium]|nr:biotin transporter BioY [Bacillota bacterium]